MAKFPTYEEMAKFPTYEEMAKMVAEEALDGYTYEDKTLREWIDILKQTRWIPVSERLPQEFANVICCTNAEEIFIAIYLGKMNDGEDCFDDNDGMMWEGDVIAWMPLPEPYKAESEVEE